MPIEIIIKSGDDTINEIQEDIFSIDGHEFSTTTGLVKKQDILDMLEYLGYITIKIEE